MINLTVTVHDTTALLDAEAYGPGALLRWESAPASTGPWVEGGTEPLVAGVSFYEIFDQNGTELTFYRTRITTAAGTAPSPYSAIWQPAAAGPTLTLEELKAIIGETSASDEWLQMALNAAFTAIAQVAGAWSTTTETHRDSFGYSTLVLANQASSVTSVTEDGVLLASSDYELSGYVLRRLDAEGDWSTWGSKVVVVYEPIDLTYDWQRVQAELVKLELAYNPGIVSVHLGDWSESYPQGDRSYAREREAILSTLSSAGGGMWIVG